MFLTGIMDIELILERLAIASLLPGVIWLFLTMHVLHFSELKHGRSPNYSYQLWFFYKHFKDNYPESSAFAKKLFYICILMIAPYCIWLLVKGGTN
tara:strand:+ start:408 stop:695 length:288 start_codon:yes stop_codon:yes gene_type:complete